MTIPKLLHQARTKLNGSWLRNPMLKKLRAKTLVSIENAQHDFRLVPFELPELTGLKSRHERLLRSYAQALLNISKVGFFISPREVDKPIVPPGIRPVFLLTSRWSIVRLFNLRPLAKFFLDLHVRGKLKELMQAYVQTRFLVTGDQPDRKKYLDWLGSAKTECESFLGTLSTGKMLVDTLKYLGVSVSALLLATAGAGSLSELLVQFFIKGEMSIETFIVLFLLVAAAILIVPVVGYMFMRGFTIKRQVLMNLVIAGVEQDTVYKIENELFSALGRQKKRELALDYLVNSVLYGLLYVGIWWAFVQAGQKGDPFVFLSFFCLTSPFLFGIYFVNLRPWRKRSLRGDM